MKHMSSKVPAPTRTFCPVTEDGEHVFTDDRSRCPACGFVFFAAPAGVAVSAPERNILRRGRKPGALGRIVFTRAVIAELVAVKPQSLRTLMRRRGIGKLSSDAAGLAALVEFLAPRLGWKRPTDGTSGAPPAR